MIYILLNIIFSLINLLFDFAITYYSEYSDDSDDDCIKKIHDSLFFAGFLLFF